MTKNELIAMVSDKAQINKNDAAKAVEATFDIITGALKQGDEVKLVGFGSFTVSQRKAREGRNPRTGEMVPVDEKAVPFFKAGKELRERVNRGRSGRADG